MSDPETYFAYQQLLAKQKTEDLALGAEPSEADQVMRHVSIAAAAVFARMKKKQLEQLQKGAEEILDPAALYTVNDEYQAFTQRAAKSYSGKTWDLLESEVLEDCRTTGAAWISKHVKSIYPNQPIHRGAVVGVEAVHTSSSGSYLLRTFPVLLHVWKSRKEARLFHETIRRLAQTKFESLISSPLHVFIAGLFAHLGGVVSCVWLPPLVNDSLLDVPGGTATHSLLSLWKDALRVPAATNMPVALGGDGRFYCFPAPTAICCHGMQTPVPHDCSGAWRLEWVEHLEGQIPDLPVQALNKERIPQCAIALSHRTDVLTSRYGKLQSQALLADRVVPEALHDYGLNVCHAFLLFLSPDLKPTDALSTATLVQTIVVEMIARTLRSMLQAAFRTLQIPDTASAEVHHVQRIVLANQVLSQFGKSPKRFVADSLMPVLRKKFVSVPADFVFSSGNINVPMTMIHLAKLLCCDLDPLGKSFLRFRSEPSLQSLSVFRRHRIFAAAVAWRVPADAQDTQFLNKRSVDVVPQLELWWESLNSLSLRNRLCQRLKIYRMIHLIGNKSLMPSMSSLIEAEFSTMKKQNQRHADDDQVQIFQLLSGIYAELAPNSHAIEDFGMMHLELLQSSISDHFAETLSEELDPILTDLGLPDLSVTFPIDDFLCVERYRVLAKVLASSGAHDEAASFFNMAKLGFKHVFRLSTCYEQSSIFFDLMLLEVRHAIKTVEIPELVVSGVLEDLIEACQYGADQEQRREGVKVSLYVFCAKAAQIPPQNYAELILSAVNDDGDSVSLSAESEPEIPVLLKKMIHLTSQSVTLHHVTDGAGHISTIALVHYHILLLIWGKYNCLTPSVREEIDPILTKLHSVCTELFGNDAVVQQRVLDSEWCKTSVGRLIEIAMEQGQWHAAGAVLAVMQERYEKMDKEGIGTKALQKPVKMLARAQDVTYTIRKYFHRLIYSDVDLRGVPKWEALHRTGVEIMRKMHFSTLFLQLEQGMRLIYLQTRIGWEAKVTNVLATHNFVQQRIAILLGAEEHWRRVCMKEHEQWVDDSFFQWEALNRHHVKYCYWSGVGAAVYFLSTIYRRNNETAETREYLAFFGEIETASRRAIWLHQQATVRELFLLAAMRVLQRIAQGEMLVRVQPAVSLYFYSEEDAIRSIIEEEWLTSMEEMRLKERIFRMGVLRDLRMKRNFPKMFASSSPAQASPVNSKPSPSSPKRETVENDPSPAVKAIASHRSEKRARSVPIPQASPSKPVKSSPDKPVVTNSNQGALSPDALRKLWEATKTKPTWNGTPTKKRGPHHLPPL